MLNLLNLVNFNIEIRNLGISKFECTVHVKNIGLYKFWDLLKITVLLMNFVNETFISMQRISVWWPFLQVRSTLLTLTLTKHRMIPW